jgi:hypothetical protein
MTSGIDMILAAGVTVFGNIVEDFMTLPEREQNYVIGGALFWIGLIVITYFAVTSKKI